MSVVVGGDDDAAVVDSMEDGERSVESDQSDIESCEFSASNVRKRRFAALLRDSQEARDERVVSTAQSNTIGAEKAAEVERSVSA